MVVSVPSCNAVYEWRNLLKVYSGYVSLGVLCVRITEFLKVSHSVSWDNRHRNTLHGRQMTSTTFAVFLARSSLHARKQLLQKVVYRYGHTSSLSTTFTNKIAAGSSLLLWTYLDVTFTTLLQVRIAAAVYFRSHGRHAAATINHHCQQRVLGVVGADFGGEWRLNLQIIRALVYVVASGHVLLLTGTSGIVWWPIWQGGVDEHIWANENT